MLNKLWSNINNNLNSIQIFYAHVYGKLKDATSLKDFVKWQDYILMPIIDLGNDKQFIVIDFFFIALFELSQASESIYGSTDYDNIMSPNNVFSEYRSKE